MNSTYKLVVRHRLEPDRNRTRFTYFCSRYTENTVDVSLGSQNLQVCTDYLRQIAQNDLRAREYITRTTLIFAGVLRKRLGICRDLTRLIAQLFFAEIFARAKETLVY